MTFHLESLIMIRLYPGVAQLVARMVRVHEAVGSTPATRTSKKCCNLSDYSTFSFFEYTLKYTLIYWDIFIESVCVGFRPPGKTILQHNINQPGPLSGHLKRDIIYYMTRTATVSVSTGLCVKHRRVASDDWYSLDVALFS